ncbi:hypothetical protein [uncultured Roseibium sp.]|uniref:hypothetical protein n=1 Tax=uncultured Roseibium sp. TaxID=1936171 RepID=UPI0032166653
MSGPTKSPARHLIGRHLIGLSVTILALAIIVWVWRDGLNYLNGTIFSEMRYLAFAGFVVVFLTAVNKVTDKFLH